MTFDPNTLLCGNILGKTPFRRMVVPSGGYVHPSVVGWVSPPPSSCREGGRTKELKVVSASSLAWGAREYCLRRRAEAILYAHQFVLNTSLACL